MKDYNELLDYITDEKEGQAVQPSASLIESITYLLEPDLTTTPIDAPSRKVKQLDGDNWMTYKLYLVNNPHLPDDEKEYYENLIKMLIEEEQKELEKALSHISICQEANT